jgi:hypothetical protein
MRFTEELTYEERITADWLDGTFEGKRVSIKATRDESIAIKHASRRNPSGYLGCVHDLGTGESYDFWGSGKSYDLMGSSVEPPMIVRESTPRPLYICTECESDKAHDEEAQRAYDRIQRAVRESKREKVHEAAMANEPMMLTMESFRYDHVSRLCDGPNGKTLDMVVIFDRHGVGKEVVHYTVNGQPYYGLAAALEAYNKR